MGSSWHLLGNRHQQENQHQQGSWHQSAGLLASTDRTTGVNRQGSRRPHTVTSYLHCFTVLGSLLVIYQKVNSACSCSGEAFILEEKKPHINITRIKTSSLLYNEKTEAILSDQKTKTRLTILISRFCEPNNFE